MPDPVARLRTYPPGSQSGSIVIVGAGMAGLSAAHELQRLGFRVIILEADEIHMGGRVRTFRDGTHYGEQGAMRIPADHDLTHFYVKEMGLSLRKFVQMNTEAFLLARSVRVRMRDAPSLLSRYELTSAEAQLGDIGLWNQTVGALVRGLSSEEAADLWRDVPKTPRMRALDRRSLYSLWVEHAFSPGAIQLLASTWNLETSLHVSLTEHMREELEGTWMEDFDEVVGGMDQLPHALAKSLTVTQGCPVVEIAQDEMGVEVIYSRRGGLETVRGDWVLCTVPLSVLGRIKIVPALSPQKLDAIRRISYDSSTKVLALAKHRFWETDDGIFGGGSVSDGSLGSTWYPSDNTHQNPDISNAPSMFLASYSWGQTARRMSRDAARDIVVPELSAMHDSLKYDPGLIEGYVRWSWDEHPWSSGAYSFFQPGEHVELFEALVAPEGRLLLAGEHASFTHSWIQGAIASGLRAASYIVEHSASLQAVAKCSTHVEGGYAT
jgi:monoamine oxidase